MDGPISPKPLLDPRPEMLPAYLSNGCIGLRVTKVPLFSGLAIVNGYSAIDPTSMVEGSTPAPYPLAGDIQVGGVSMGGAADQVEFRRQSYDFSCGELESAFRVRIGDVGADVDVLTFCCRSMPWVVAQQVSLRVDRATDIVMRALVDPSGVPGSWISRDVDTPGAEKPAVDGWLHWLAPGALSTCGAAYVTEFSGTDDVQRTVDRWNNERPLSTGYAFRARRGQTYVLRQLTALIPSEVHHQPDRESVRMVAAAAKRGFGRLRDANRALWDELWKGRIRIDARDSRWQELADAAFFYLHTSVHSSSPSSTSMFGLSRWHNYHYYRGHVMWDVDAFAIPPLLLTYPAAAEALLDFRVRGIEAAWMNARLQGYTGLQFPWEAGPTRGEEASPAEGAAASHEHHVSLSVALAFARHFHATGDEHYLRDKGWRVVSGVANWIVSRAKRTSRGYEILEVGGIAEKKEPVNNNAFVNMTAMLTLETAIELAQELGYPAPARWQQVAEGLPIPCSSRNVIMNHDAYRPNEEKGETPETLAALFPFDYRLADRRLEERTIRYYLDLAQRYVGAPMLSAPLGVYAAWIGDRAQSLKLFEDGYAAFELQPFNSVDEYRADKFPEMPRAGPFFANMGGFVSSLLFGLPGLVLDAGDPQRWPQRNVVLPEGWESIEVERLWVRGEPAGLTARHGALATLTER